MKRPKIALLAVAAGALMAFSGPASATQLTGTGGTVLGVGTTIHAEAEESLTLHVPIGGIECDESILHGTVGNAGGTSATVSVSLSTLTFNQCNAAFVVLNPGSLEIHTKTASADNNGTLTSKGTRLTTTFSGFHCIFETSPTTGTDIGTLTGSSTTGGVPTLDIEATIPRVGGSSGFFCGQTAEWTGSYSFNSPSPLNID